MDACWGPFCDRGEQRDIEFSKEDILKLRTFCIYGLGTTGKSVINYFNRENFKKYDVWDDNISVKTKVDNFM